MSILREIVLKKKERLAQAKSICPMAEIKAMAADVDAPRDFRSAIKKTPGIRLIAEIKKASPSKGIIRTDLNPVEIAKIYNIKAHAISVLTEEDYFQGSLNYIRLVKSVSERPVLRKDFIFDPYQIYETRAFGADAILLIAACLEKSQAEDLYGFSKELGMAVLYEVHSLKEIEYAISAGFDIIGVNNRDLNTMKIDLSTSLKAKQLIPDDRLVVAESGIKTRRDVLMLEEAGIDAILVGTALMEASDIAGKIDELMGYEQETHGQG